MDLPSVWTQCWVRVGDGVESRAGNGVGIGEGMAGEGTAGDRRGHHVG